MVLRFILFLTLVIGAQTTFARSSKKVQILKKAKTYHAKKKYKSSNYIIQKAYNPKRPKNMPVEILYLYSLNFQKMGNHTSALYYFNQLIKKAYVKTHIQVIKALKKDNVDSINIPKVLRATYYYMGLSYFALFKQNERLANAKKARRYFKICDDIDFNDGCADFIEELDEKQQEVVKKVDEIEFFILGSILVFQDDFKVNSTTTAETNTVIATTSALCYGAGLRYGNSFKGWEAQGCIYSGTATVKDDSSSIEYKQAGVPVAGMMFEAGYYIKPQSGDTRLSLSVPVLYRSGLFSTPDGYTVEEAKEYKYGLMLTAGWQVWFFEAQMKLANMQDTNLLSLQGVINF